MSVLQALGLAGFRSYSPQSLQQIEFETPLTLIWGKNGSGKTTIIEVLKYITTGALPPSCDKGKNFVMDPKMINQSEIVGDARLKFRAFNDKLVLAKRRTLLAVTTKGGKFESIEQTLKTKDQKGQMFEINHQCAEIEKQIPQLLGISKAVLENIVFCHQDESLWPFSDSSNLKAIFDEMFETRRYTKIIDSFWEQYKEYTKEIKESKKAMEYLKRLYDEDNKKKRIAIRQMEKVAEQSQQLVTLKESLQQLNISPNASKQASDRKYQLIMKRGTLEERINVGTRTVKDLKARMNAINIEYSNIFGTQVQTGQITTEIQRKIIALNRRKQELQQQLEETQSATVFTQKQMEILGQVKRAKLCLPQLKNENNQQEILQKLYAKCVDMQSKRGELSKLKKQRDQIVLPALLDLPLTQIAYQEQKRALSAQSQRCEQAKQEILRMFNSLYKAVSSKRSKECDQNVEEKLRQVQMRLKLKREELAKYEAMPSFESIQLQRIRLHYSGIEFQQMAFQYCTEKKKCVLCSKQLMEADLKAMKVKCERSVAKTTKSLQELEEKNARNGHAQQLNPQQVIPLLRKEIAVAEAAQAKLALAYEEYTTYKQQSEQAKLNQKLTACLRRIGLEREAGGSAGHNNATEQAFLQRVGQYQNLKLRLDHRGKEVRLYEDRVKKNRDIQQQRKTISQQASKIRQRIGEYEQQSEGYELVSSIYHRLNSLLKSMGNRKPNSKSKQSDNDSSSPEELEQQLATANRQLRGLALQKEYTQANMQVTQLEEDGKLLFEEFRNIDRDLRALQEQMEATRAREEEYAKINVQYISRRRQLDLKADLAFQEYHHPVEKEYLLKKMQLASKEATAHDIQMLCRSMEGSISAFHRQKMDEVNKYLAQIWREVYHGEDIRLIQIQAAFEEDSKRRKGYSYSIVMEKAGGKKMEMKGRCSMGQKVLASIVIRLALAQVFANSARILALDEPTTNLDREHICNLAQQLGRLVELNEGKYLQMIIISHDLEFVRMMEKYTTSYYEVARDEQKFSKIIRKEIREIYEQL